MTVAADQVQMHFPASRYRSAYLITVSGFVVLIPITLWGTALIVDYPGPPGSLGWAELPGWWSLCLSVAIIGRQLMLRWRSAIGFLASLVSPLLLTAGTYVDIRPSTPPAIKDAVEYGLQGIGLLALLLSAVALTRIAFRWIRRPPESS